MFKKVVEQAGSGVGDAVSKQVHKEFQGAKKDLLDTWYGREADDFMQKLMSAVVDDVSHKLPQAFTEKCAKAILKSLETKNQSFFQAVKSKFSSSKSTDQVLNILANQLLAVLMHSRLQFRDYVEKEGNILKRVLASGEDITKYFDTKKRQIRDLMEEQLCQLLEDIGQAYVDNKKLGLDEIKPMMTECFDAIEQAIETTLKNPEQDDALFQAAKEGSLSQCYVAIALGANIHFHNKKEDMKTALHVAAENGHHQVVDALLSINIPGQKADVDALDKYNRTPLQLAVVNNIDEPNKLHPIVERLCQAGAKTDVVQHGHPPIEVNWDGWTPLLILSYKYNNEDEQSSLNYTLAMIETLLKHGANPDIAVEGTKWTEFTGNSRTFTRARNFVADAAGMQGYSEKVARSGKTHRQEEGKFFNKNLPSFLAKPIGGVKEAAMMTVSQDYVGKTPLHFAVNKSSAKMLELLLTYKASADIEDVNGRKAIDYGDAKSPVNETLQKYMEQSNPPKPPQAN